MGVNVAVTTDADTVSIDPTRQARRGNLFVLLLLLAASVMDCVQYAVNHVQAGRGLGGFTPAAIRGVEDVRDVRAALLWAEWFASDIGVFVPLFVIAGCTLRCYSLRKTAIIIAAYQIVAAGAINTANVVYIVDHWGSIRYHAEASGHPLIYAMGTIAVWAPALVPLAIVLFVNRDDRVLRGSPMESARLTRLVMLATAATWTIGWVVAEGVDTTGSHYFLAHEWTWAKVGITSAAALQLASALILAMCAIRLVRGHCLSRWALRTAAIVEGARWVLVTTGASPFWTATCSWRSPYENAVYGGLSVGTTLPGIGVILWYWWPVLRGRTSGDLRAGVPVCEKCGYCLVGSVSGRCPECGEPSGAGGATPAVE